jgi:predicted Zn-dependent peptidase
MKRASDARRPPPPLASTAMSDSLPDPELHIAEVAQGVRVVAIRQPRRPTVNVSVFVRTGSQHETPRLNGISHFVEHMAFKGTRRRDCQRINLDAELLGAEVNAHTDKDHTAFHIDGLARDAVRFVRMLAEIVQESTFPDTELEHERQVILHELAEDDDDGVTIAFKLFDRACYRDHPFALPVIGSRRSIGRLDRFDLLDYVRRQYTATNVVVAVAGGVDPDRIVSAADSAFAAMPRAADNRVDEPNWVGGVKTHRLAGSVQTHTVIGFPAPSLRDAPEPSIVAAAVLGEGMSSPLMDDIRERRGLAYHLACSADVTELCGQFVIEASTAPEHAESFFTHAHQLLRAHAEAIDPVALRRARNQLSVRTLANLDRAPRLLESAAIDLFARGRVRTVAETLGAIRAVSAAEVRAAFGRMLAGPGSVAITGRVRSALRDRARELFDAAAS